MFDKIDKISQNAESIIFVHSHLVGVFRFRGSSVFLELMNIF